MYTSLRDNKLLQNLKKITGTVANTTNGTLHDLDQPAISLDPIKHMYMSLDNIRMTSTLLNLDIEEMCNCLAWAIQKHLDFGVKHQQVEIPDDSNF